MGNHNLRNAFSLFAIFFTFAFVLEAYDFEQSTRIINGQTLRFLNQFGFEKGGQFNISLKIQNSSSLIVVGCTPSQTEELFSLPRYRNLSKLCDSLNNLSCTWRHTYTNNMYSTSYVTNDLFLYYYVINCDFVPVTYTVNGEFTNPSGKLSTSYKRLWIAFATLGVIWIILSLVWWIIRDSSLPLHNMILLFPTSKIIWCGAATIYWYQSLYSDPRAGLAAPFYYLCYAFVEVIFCSLAFGSSLGWNYRMDRLESVDGYIIAGVSITLFVSILGGFYVSGHFTVLTIGVHVFVLVMIFMNIEKRLMEDVQVSDDFEDPRAAKKRIGTLRLRNIFIGYLVALAFTFLVSGYFLVEQQWVAQILLESVYFGFVILRFTSPSSIKPSLF